MSFSSPGMLLVGHGTRDSQGTAEFFQTAELVAAQLPDVPVEPCFLERNPPPIADAVARLIAAGVDPLVVCPLLLFAAGHAKRDIPRAVRTALGPRRRPALIQAAHLGHHERLLALSQQRFREATATLPPLPPHDVLLLLVGRGSRDPQATAEMRSLAGLRQAAAGVGEVRVAFAAMARPGFSEALGEIRAQPLRRVVVQPHLLFDGEILERLRRQVLAADQELAAQHWLVTPHLGPSPLLADCVVDRFRQALAAQAV